MAYVLITGCDKEDIPFPRCISADYFGPEPVTVSAYFPIGHDAFFPEGESGEPIDHETGEVNYGFHLNQVVKWKDTGLETNGDDLIVRVNGAWISWIKNNKKKFKVNYSLQSLEHMKYATKFGGKQCDNSLPDFHLICIVNDNEKSISSNESPCWFTNGHGAYLLLRKPGDGNPNESLKSMRNPESPTIHLNYNSVAEDGSGLFTLKRGDKTKLKSKNCDNLKLEKGWKIYVKILDRYYLNNVGGYSFEFLSGVQTLSSFGFFDYVYHYLKCVLLMNKNCKKYFDSNEPAAAQAMFQNIAEKSTNLHNFIFSLLVLFIVVSSLLYLFGMVQETKYDLLIRMIKITLVTVLISPGSFNFFYDHFLTLFVEGLEYIINLITNFATKMNTGANLNTDESKLFSFMEDMFNKFFAYSVWKKFAAFLSYQIWITIFMVPVIFIGIILYFLLCVYAYIIFLSGFVGIAFFIAIMPLFLISILFSPLKSLFEGWIKFCVSFCLQSIIIFALLSFLASMIMNTFYRQLGFTVCYNKWLEIKLCTPKWMFGGFCIFDKQYFRWTPGQVFVPYSIGEASTLNIDEYIEGMENLSREGGTVKFTGGARYILLPPDYLNKGFRYIDYPFFNPFPGTEADHYIAESDIVVNTNCGKKDLVRLTNSLLHASEKDDILLLIRSIDKKINGSIIDRISRLHCQSTSDADKCRKNYYVKIIDAYKGIIGSDLKDEIKSLVRRIVESEKDCKVVDFNNLYVDYSNDDFQRVQDIQRGYLINLGEIFLLFLLSFLVFSLCEFVQQIGSSIAGGGYSVYNISRMYEYGGILFNIPAPKFFRNVGINNLMELIFLPKHLFQDTVGGMLVTIGNFTTMLPNRLALYAVNLLSRVPRVGGVLKYVVDVPRKFIVNAIEVTKFATSPNAKEDITQEEIARYLYYYHYYKGYIGSHLGYPIEDAIKFTWEHEIDSIGKKHINNKSLLYKAKLHRRKFLKKLYDYTIGFKRKQERRNEGDSSQSIVKELGKLLSSSELNLRKSDEFFFRSKVKVKKKGTVKKGFKKEVY